MIHFRPRVTKILRPIFTTAAQENTLARLYITVVNVWSSAVPSIMAEYSLTLSGMTTDSVSDIEVTIEQTALDAVRAVFSFRWLFDGFLSDLATWHLRRFVSNLRYATDTDLSAVIGPLPTDTLQAIIARNVALITNVSDQTKQKIADAVYRSLTNKTPVRELAKEISGIIGWQKKRALRIASDQTVKISTSFDVQRANALGLYKWKWLHTPQENPRIHHLARNGKIYDDRDLPEAIRRDNVGQAPFCKCKRQSIIEGDLD